VRENFMQGSVRGESGNRLSYRVGHANKSITFLNIDLQVKILYTCGVFSSKAPIQKNFLVKMLVREDTSSPGTTYSPGGGEDVYQLVEDYHVSGDFFRL
jgi:hypothetical protein